MKLLYIIIFLSTLLLSGTWYYYAHAPTLEEPGRIETQNTETIRVPALDPSI